MLDEVCHELLVDDGVKDFRDDWKKRDWAEVLWTGGVGGLVYLDDLGDFDGVWVLVFVDGFVEESGEVRSDEVGEAPEDGWLDFEDVRGFAGVEGAQELFHLF